MRRASNDKLINLRASRLVNLREKRLRKISNKINRSRANIHITRRARSASNSIELEQLLSQLEQLVKDRKRENDYIKNELLNKAVDAGRAQLSAMILHNIGNAITPVAVYTEKLKIRNPELTHIYLAKCYNDLMEHKDNLTEYISQDPRGVEVIKYMGTLIENLKEENSKTADVIDKIATGIDYVAQILSLQRTYAPRTTEIREKININLLIQDALKMQEVSISKRKITLKIELLPTIDHVLMEKNKLMQVIVNLIKNSCDAIDENREKDDHKIEITTYETQRPMVVRSREKTENRIEISTHCNKKFIGLKIKDTGIGVERERQREIFDFGTSSKGSSGFGLYYCKSFVEANKGSLILESKGRGCGSTVRMELPCSLPHNRAS
ncbi:MAG: HAMP domain-containing histidine kinase [Desulfamplus sp.]|nr:HAMP domain-containing histidine kinase [Desulfamplus sp.]MBF0413128.1 HAMP domain-containing histidine kinase [Desulfamplus sp.]